MILNNDPSLIKKKCESAELLSVDEAMVLWNLPLQELMLLAWNRKLEISGREVYFNKSVHIEPTNVCFYNCKFCSFRKTEGDSEAWNMSIDEIAGLARSYAGRGLTEVHIVGAVSPYHTLETYGEIISTVKKELPRAVIKAFSAVELIHMAEKAGVSYDKAVEYLKSCGMGTITGGGAEIFDASVRQRICPEKPSAEKWLAMHRAVHNAGITSNATMLYGHIETRRQRLEHILLIRELQQETGGFTAFIPLKYRNKNNSMSYLDECSVVEDLRTLAVSRLFLSNVPHIKAYWPMYGQNVAQIALLAGADDIDGTLADTSKIYSMAGVDEDSLSEKKLSSMASELGLVAVERDSFYNKINDR